MRTPFRVSSVEQFFLTPTFSHHTLLLDLLSSAGLACTAYIPLHVHVCTCHVRVACVLHPRAL